MIFIGFILGLILGSFVKVLADRSLNNRSFWGRSYCVNCKKHLRWYDLFPVISYLLLGGKCRYCKKSLSLEYPLIELVMGILVAVVFWHSFHNFPAVVDPFRLFILALDLVFKTFFVTILVVVAVTDLKKMFIPDRVILPAITITLGYLLLSTVLKVGYLYYFLSLTPLGRLLLPPHSEYFQRHALYSLYPMIGSLLMGFLIGGLFWALIILTKGKGMGGGDVKLGAFIGLGLGFPGALVALLLSFLTGAVVSLLLIALGKKSFGQTIPFGPFLVLGSLIALFWGSEIYNFYLNLSFNFII